MKIAVNTSGIMPELHVVDAAPPFPMGVVPGRTTSGFSGISVPGRIVILRAAAEVRVTPPAVSDVAVAVIGRRISSSLVFTYV